MARTGMRKGMGQRLTEPGSKRYIDGRRPRAARTGWLPVAERFQPKCGGVTGGCLCDHTDHTAQCVALACDLPF